jgi:hypothetical protein
MNKAMEKHGECNVAQLGTDTGCPAGRGSPGSADLEGWKKLHSLTVYLYPAGSGTVDLLPCVQAVLISVLPPAHQRHFCTPGCKKRLLAAVMIYMTSHYLRGGI